MKSMLLTLRACQTPCTAARRARTRCAAIAATVFDGNHHDGLTVGLLVEASDPMFSISARVLERAGHVLRLGAPPPKPQAS